MEIRNALQKIENYLTVVSNLNKTILSEGTMSRDELLLMKKYLYTSIDRIEDIERSLIIDKREDKSFTPSQTVENKFVPAKAKEIVEVAENDHIEEVEAALSSDQKEEMEDLVEDIHAEIEKEEMVFVGEITPLMKQEKNNQEEKLEIVPLIESIITEDYSLNKTKETTEEKVEEPVTEKVPVTQSIITEDYSLNKQEDVKEENDEEPVVEEIPLIKSIITEDYSLNKLEEKTTPIIEEVIAEEKIELPVAGIIETLTSKFEGQSISTFAEELVNNKKEETSLFEHLEQKLNTTQTTQLFELFDDGKEELHESFANNTNAFEPVVNTYETPFTASSYEHHDAVLVVEKEVETIVEQLTPSSLNDVFKPQTVLDSLNTQAKKTLSESIALNDKFIFVRELFGNHFGEYEAGLKQLESMNSFGLAENYCKEKLWNKFSWSDKPAAVEKFMALLQKRFN